ncbi:acetyl-CoA synthetase-like protein [Hesseltinella vesiculosa]|uniref:Acetyl-CoA synthetase-like protein n=1 Tax=Hesseltinella vesiculosa TaxID=101127 RepID=A0A1X2GD69_9FUNG|nr:acetyl-CoA synthetase-like protein [Hesseltinella vesiculosa]
MVQTLHSIQVSDPQPGETGIRRNILSPSTLIKSPASGVHTLVDILEYAVKTYGDKNGFGYRKVEDTFVEEKEITKVVLGETVKEKKLWTFQKLSGYHYISYTQAKEASNGLGAGLVHLGLTKGDRLLLFASTSYEWMFIAHGAFTQSITIATAYDTLGEDGLQHSINETQTTTCFVNGDHLKTLLRILPNCARVDKVVYRGDAKQAELDALRSLPQIKELLSYDQLLQLGLDHPHEPVHPSAEDLACIMYTSGSTGTPKGVMLTHGNIVAGVAGSASMLEPLAYPDDTVLAYLPLAHVLEFLVQSLCIFLGLTLGYGSIRTLTDDSVRGCRGDIFEFAPSILTGVPQVWETIRKTIMKKVIARGPRIPSIFNAAIELKDYLASYGLPTWLIDRVVFKQVKLQLGGRLRYGLSGGAPLATETQRFLSVALCPIVGGYGMTESVGMCTILSPEYFALGDMGAPVPCTEIKLVDVPEAGYFATNKPKPQGEIYIRGPSVTSGYYLQDDVTKQAFTEDGWLMTGDIGEWNETGTLSIIDRKKNLVKLSNGEYIALEKLESKYKSAMFVENMCVYADPLYPRPVALLVPVENQLVALAKENDWPTNDFTALCASADTRKLVLDLLQQHALACGLKGAEIIADVWICKDLWTTESGLVTAAQKLKRHDIKAAFQKELDQMTQGMKS